MCRLFIESSPTTSLAVFYLPKNLKLEGKTFNLLCATFNIGAHFKGIFFIDNQYILVDDMKNKHLNFTIPDHKIVTCFYYLT